MRDDTKSQSTAGASSADEKSEGAESTELQHLLCAFGRIDGGRVLVNMRAKLPTEIRWIVYGHLLDDEPTERLLRKPLDDLSLEPFNQSVGLWWDTSVVGEPDVKHLVEMYLERTYLQFHTNYALGQLIRIADPWKCGLSAGNIRLDVEFTILINQEHGESCTEEDMMNWPLVVREKKVLRDLEALFGFKKGTRLTLEIHDVAAEKRKGLLFTDRSHLHLLIQMSVLPLIFDTMTRFSRRGYRLGLATYAARDKKSYFDVPVHGGMDKVLNIETEEHIGSLQALQNSFHEVS